MMSGEQEWPIRLFNKSVLKQRKLREILVLLGPTQDLRCLDIGSDNGVISYLLRRQGGIWKSADLDEDSIRSIRTLVKSGVYQINGGRTPFDDDEFDRVAILDFLEHIPDDQGFIREMFRILRPDGQLIINVPHLKNDLLRKFRHAIGQTDEKHGHLRPGYTIEDLRRLLGGEFTPVSYTTYSKFFSELVDALVVFAVSLLQGGKRESTPKGLLVTGDDLRKNHAMFRLYSLIYPVVWLFSKLDNLLFFTSGYMLVAKARVNKQPVHHESMGNGWHRDELIFTKDR